MEPRPPGLPPRPAALSSWARRGQLVIPALFVLPSLMLFMYLILETAKLSREKIRHQFAVDSAAFIEMTNYADLLNRSAYVNGAFPFRVFHESWPPGMTLERSDSNTKDPMLQVLYGNGVFPAYGGQPLSLPDIDDQGKWPVFYDPNSEMGARLNTNDEGATPDLLVFRHKNAQQYWLWFDHHSVPLWQFTMQVFGLLGSVEDAQIKVYDRLAGNKSFYKKSWMLNTGLPNSTADSSAFDGKKLQVRCIYTPYTGIYGRYQTTNMYEFYNRIKGFGGDPDANGGNPHEKAAGSGDFCREGLFRVAVVKQADLDRIRVGKGGVSVKQRWTAPKNYFNVNLNTPRPEVHASVGIMGGCVWKEDSTYCGNTPTPTPKFQTRQLP